MLSVCLCVRCVSLSPVQSLAENAASPPDPDPDRSLESKMQHLQQISKCESNSRTVTVLWSWQVMWMRGWMGWRVTKFVSFRFLSVAL